MKETGARAATVDISKSKRKLVSRGAQKAHRTARYRKTAEP